MALTLLDLPWLPAKSESSQSLLADRQALRAASPAELVPLAQQRLAPGDVTKLYRVLKAFRGDAREQGLIRLRVCMAFQTTPDLLAEELVVAGLRIGLLIDVIAPDFNQLAELAYGDFFDSPENRSIDFTIVGLDYRQLGFRRDQPGAAEAAERELADKLALVVRIVDGIRARTGSVCVVQNLVEPSDLWLGSLDGRLPGTPRWQVQEFNRRLAADLAGSGNLLFDVERIAATIGLSRWQDPGMWYMAKLGCSQAAMPYYAHRLAVLLAAARGRSRRVLVLDLDNTLWGGVIGDDGVEGIVLGQGSAAGEAHLDVQLLVRMLAARGIVLGVVSKNQDEVARRPFTEHAEMQLGLDDFAAFTANWEDKASNIRQMAATLELGLDSFVFLDDNPMERDIVRRNLPQVAVPEVGSNAADFVTILMAAGYFESVSFGAEDRDRTQMYRDNAQRSAQMEQVGDYDAYLVSLAMKIQLLPFDHAGRSRITQLINKSNQFNLTTRRYTELEVEALEQDPEVFTLQVRLADCFGDNGMISVVICRRQGDHWEIDTWLMSCRVLKRRVEERILQHLVERARERGLRRIRGIFRPTAKNQIVAGHYARLGFAADPAGSADETSWWLGVDGYDAVVLPFQTV